MIRVWQILTAAFFVSGCASTLDQDGAVAVIPYEIGSSGHIIVETMVNGQGPFAFALDTAASISVVFDRTREKTGLECSADERVLVQGMVGSGEFPTAIVDRLHVGGLAWRDIRVAAMPCSTALCAEIDGILGVDILIRYAVGFSANDKALRLYAPEVVGARSYGGWASIPLRPLKIGTGDTTLHSVDISIFGKTLTALFDLGAGINIMNWRAARSIGVRMPRQRDSTELSGAVDSTSVTAHVNIREVNAADTRWYKERFFISDLHLFEVLHLDDRPMAIVGAGLFSQRDFVIDFARGRLLVKVSMREVAEREGFEPSKGF